MRVGIDLMGSDHPPQKLFEAVKQYTSVLSSSHHLVVIAEESVVQRLPHDNEEFYSSDHSKKVSFVSAGQSVEMHELPQHVIRRKKDSSIAIGIRMLSEKALDAFVSPGNTGALILSAMLTLKRLPCIDRPALLATLPSEKGPVAVLDVGANVSSKPNHLFQFAQIGAVYQQCSTGIEAPRVGLLNIGVEAQKGTADLREVYKTLESYCTNYQKSSGHPEMRFLGNVEGRDVFRGDIDVLVTDGFTGNVFLKTAEGASTFILRETKQAFEATIPTESKTILKGLYHHLDYSEYPGAILCGINGVVVKVHGNSGSKALYNGIKGTFHLLEQRLVEKIKTQLLNLK